MDKTFTIKLTAQHLDVIGKALMTVAYGEAAPVVNSINQQLAELQKEPDEQE